jgi:hypothetical protein
VYADASTAHVNKHAIRLVLIDDLFAPADLRHRIEPALAHNLDKSASAPPSH